MNRNPRIRRNISSGRPSIAGAATLSDKFALLAPVKQQNRRANVVIQQRGKRADLTNARRNIVPNAAAVVGGGIQRGGNRNRGRGIQGNKGGGRGAGGRGGRGGRGKGRGRGGNNNSKGDNKKVSGEDLDLEMDKYWFTAGKGPDPVASKLDREMDDYFQAKNKVGVAAAAVAVDVNGNPTV